jgi:hypothetical protein
VKTLSSLSLVAVEESAVGISPVAVCEETGATSLVVIAAGGAGLQVGISPANAETDRAHAIISIANIRFIGVTPV